MYNTREMLIKLVDNNLLNQSYKSLILEYQKELNPIYFATIFEKLFDMIVMISERYPTVNEQDAVSIALVKLDDCLRKFNFKNNFTTYFHICYSSKLSTKKSSNDSHSRKANLQNNIISDSEYQLSYKSLYSRILDLELSIEQTDFSIREKQFLNLLLKGYTRPEISNIMKITEPTLAGVRLKLQTKKLYEILKS